ncbi:MAG: AmmeMemoRadiSam system radical SAM enzyme [Acidobacteria bacterium]|nr:AmmeMemoRadiSam system radical SAM enzyme [Acidobacteriota bacterium]
MPVPLWAWDPRGLPDTAPRARYWVSGASAGADCSACHLQPGTLDRGHSHQRSTVFCQLCAQRCTIKSGETGRCRARMNVGGELRSLVYGRPLAVHVDPIEKKPFYHFLPGSAAFSLGTSGCPLRCKFCQNWQLSQSSPGDYDVAYTTHTQIVDEARRRAAPVVAFTYNEPTTFIEYALDIAALARRRGLRSVMISCGFMNERPLADLCGALDAIKIDLKGFSEDFYANVSGAALAPVLRSIKQVHQAGVHLEIVNLVVPTLNDADASMRALADWVMGELGPDVPLHFTRFHPDYQLLNLPPTPIATLERARAMAMDRGVRYVYVGNVPGHAGNHTYCPGCKAAVIKRQDFFVVESNLKNGRCGACGRAIAGVWV